MDQTDSTRTVDQSPGRWMSLSNVEIGALLVGLAASDRDGSIDHTGKALWAELEQELARRLDR